MKIEMTEKGARRVHFGEERHAVGPVVYQQWRIDPVTKFPETRRYIAQHLERDRKQGWRLFMVEKDRRWRTVHLYRIVNRRKTCRDNGTLQTPGPREDK